MKSNAEISVGQLVAERPARARVFEKLGIDYCCGGKRSLHDICREKHLDVAAVLLEVDGPDTTSDITERNWSSASVTDLCDQIEQTHHAYLKQELPRLELMTTKVAERHGDKRPALREVRDIFKTLKEEMDSHMAKEEHILFPLCRKLDVADTLPKIHCGSIGNPIEVMMQEHADTGDELARIRTLTDDFTCPPDACNTFRAMYDSLQQLEQDMHQHVHKENNILFPKAIRLEKMLAREDHKLPIGFGWFSSQNTEFRFSRSPGKIAKRFGARLFRNELSDRRTSERFLNHGDCLIKPAMQRAKIDAVTFDAERALFDSLDRINCLDDIENGDGVRRPGQH